LLNSVQAFTEGVPNVKVAFIASTGISVTFGDACIPDRWC
jgi:hypothetical protein